MPITESRSSSSKLIEDLRYKIEDYKLVTGNCSENARNTFLWVPALAGAGGLKLASTI